MCVPTEVFHTTGDPEGRRPAGHDIRTGGTGREKSLRGWQRHGLRAHDRRPPSLVQVDHSVLLNVTATRGEAGVRLVDNYRSQFVHVMWEGAYAGLVGRLEAMISHSKELRAHAHALS